MLWCIDDNVFDKSVFDLTQRLECYITLIVKELDNNESNKIIFFNSILESFVNYIEITVTNISNNIIKQYYGIIYKNVQSSSYCQKETI